MILQELINKNNLGFDNYPKSKGVLKESKPSPLYKASVPL